MKGNYGILGIVVFCFFLVPFYFGKYSPSDHSVLLLSESDGEQMYPGNQPLFFLFLLCCTSDVLLVKMLTFDKLYVNNQMVVLCTKFCFVFFFFCCWSKKKMFILKGSYRKWGQFWARMETLACKVVAADMLAASHSRCIRKTHHTNFSAILNWKYLRIAAMS